MRRHFFFRLRVQSIFGLGLLIEIRHAKAFIFAGPIVIDFGLDY